MLLTRIRMLFRKTADLNLLERMPKLTKFGFFSLGTYLDKRIL